jgi:hypothetical protein
MMLMGLVCNSCYSCKMGFVFLLGSYINKWYGGYDCGGSQVFVGGLNWNCWTFFFWFIRGEFLWYIYGLCWICTEALSLLKHSICLSKSVYLDPYQMLSKVKTTVTFVQCINYILHYTSHIDIYPNVLLSYLFGWVSNHAIHNPWSWVSWSWLSMKLSSQESSTFFIYLFISCNVNIHLILGSH